MSVFTSPRRECSHAIKSLTLKRFLCKSECDTSKEGESKRRRERGSANVSKPELDGRHQENVVAKISIESERTIDVYFGNVFTCLSEALSG